MRTDVRGTDCGTGTAEHGDDCHSDPDGVPVRAGSGGDCVIEINFQSNSVENLIRQIQAFVEKIEIKEVKKRGRHEKGETTSGSDSDLG